MGKLLTVVVPSYNAEKYLRHNLDSLCLDEILEELEVIVVDDGSTDSTARIADEYAEKYPGTVVPVHKENGGHGSGINTGINHATGIYFKVIDADDWADAEDLKNLIRYIKELVERYRNMATQDVTKKDLSKDAVDIVLSNAAHQTENGDTSRKASVEKKEDTAFPDIIAGGFYWVFGQDDAAPRREEFTKPFEDVEYGRVYRFDDVAEKAYIKMHSMTIRTDILKENHIWIDEKCYYVDTEYILYPIPYVNTVVFLDDHLYRYSISREGQSMSPQQMMKNKMQYDHVLESLYRFYQKAKEKNTLSSGKKRYIENLISRVYASRIKILLWDQISSKTRRELITMENKLKKNYPGIYVSNMNRALKLFRKSGYWLYYPAAIMMRIRQGNR